MTNRTALVGLAAFGLLVAACSRQAPAPVPTPDDAAASPVASQPEPAASTRDWAPMARDLIKYIDAAPQCQTYIDRLEAVAKTPADQPLTSDPGAIYAEAYKADCVKKTTEKQQ